MSLRIRTIARLTGIREATLRAWERRYGFPRPHRSENNYRVYAREEVEAIRRVALLVAEGLAVSEAIAQVRAVPTDALPAEERLQERFWSAVMVLDSEGAERVLQEAAAALPPLAVCDRVLMPVLREMSARLDVAREHLASGLVRQQLRNLLTAQEAPEEGPRALLACPAKDFHEGGLLALGLHLKARGWRVMLLGADTPAEALASACAVGRPRVVALSCVRRREAAELRGLLAEAVEACRPVPVVAGGGAAREHLREVFAAGAQYAESVDELLALCEQLPPPPGPGAPPQDPLLPPGREGP
jgi:DNA-binding transcriptional MerR regulator